MKIIYSDLHSLHKPEFEIFEGQMISHAEKPERMLAITSTLRSNGFNFIKPKDFSVSYITRIHNKNYFNFTKSQKFGRSCYFYQNRIFSSRGIRPKQ